MRRNKVKIKNKQVMCMLATVILQSAVAAFPAQAGELQLFCADGAVDPLLSFPKQTRWPERFLKVFYTPCLMLDGGLRLPIRIWLIHFSTGFMEPYPEQRIRRQSASTLRIAREPLTLLWYMKSVMQQTLSWTWYPILPSLNRYLKKKNTRS